MAERKALNYEVMEREAIKMADCYDRLYNCFNECANTLEDVSDAMQSSAGVSLLQRFNNLAEQYCNRYMKTLQKQADYLYDTAQDFRQREETLRDKSKSALTHFDNV